MDSACMRTTILYHGNCIDGWFSAYFAYCALMEHGKIQMFPIAPSQANTWPSSELMADTDVWLLDVSVPAVNRKEWMKDGVRSIQCIDHHATSIGQWCKAKCDGPCVCENNPICTDCCAALQTWRHFYPDQEVPEWLHSIDRVDRWVNVTYEDRCLREFLHDIARLPVQRKLKKALDETYNFIYWMQHHPEESMKGYCGIGEVQLKKKDAELLSVIEKGRSVVIDAGHLAEWRLPETWLGLTVFLMDTTDIILDTTEAAHLVFTSRDATVFINYRNKTFYTKPRGGIMKSMLVYSARSRGFNVTDGTIFEGHPTAAGASLVRGVATHFPFVSGVHSVAAKSAKKAAQNVDASHDVEDVVDRLEKCTVSAVECDVAAYSADK